MLTDLQCKAATVAAGDKVAKHYDFEGLYLFLQTGKGKYWRWDYTFEQRRRCYSYGTYPKVSLKDARAKHIKNLEILRKGFDPMQAKSDAKHKLVTANENSFEVIARDWHATKSGLPAPSGHVYLTPSLWTKDHAQRVLSQLESHVFKSIGSRPVAEITTHEFSTMLAVTQAKGIRYTAKRICENCSQIFDFAAKHGRGPNNPARLVSDDIKAPPVRHRPALTDLAHFGEFVRDLAEYEKADRLTLLGTRLAMLTLLRSGELRAGLWSEVNLPAKEWRIPASRMKQNKGDLVGHIVPLSKEALETFEELKLLSGSGLQIFPASFGGGEMSENTIARMLARLGYKGRQSLHGFRASGRSLLAERGWNFAALERQLDHEVGNATVKAYARSDFLEERKALMDDWGYVISQLEAGKTVARRSFLETNGPHS